MNQWDLQVLARTIWGEARNQGVEGMTAVAHVILNRVNDKRWPNTIAGVCFKRRHFSLWDSDSANAPNRMATVQATDEQLKTCMAVAWLAVAGMSNDPTDGANHYHTLTVSPAWKDPSKVTVTIGDHVFYRL